MSTELEVRLPAEVPTYRDIKALESAMCELPQADGPLVHRFAEGLYARELFMPATMTLVGKMHRKSHFFVLLEGEITAWTDHGMQRMAAPQVFRTEPGTKRVIHAHVDSRIVTFHATQLTDVDAIESEIIIPDPDEAAFLASIGKDPDTSSPLIEARSDP